nr:hypothetical protein [Tanacetum cinerariifolium]
KDGEGVEPSGEDAPIKGRSLETGEEEGVEKSTERGSNDTKELVNVLISLDAANILTSRVQVVSVPPAAEVFTVGIPTGSDLVPTASVVTPYSRRKGKEKMVESDMPKKQKLQEQIDVQMAREIEEQMARKDQKRNEQIARDPKIARIHIDLINEMVKYQDHHSKILKYQAQQSKPLSKKQQREFYMLVLKSHSGWKTKHFKGMTLEEVREKFIPLWKQIEDFAPMASKEKGERFKRKRLRLEQDSAKKMKTTKDVSEEDLKEMMQLVPVEELWNLVKETLSIRQATSDKEKELWVELKRDQKIFMLIEKDYPLRKGLAIVMISNKLQGRIVRNKMLKSFPLPVMKFLLPEYFPTTSEEVFPLLSQRDAPAKEVCTAEKLKVNRGQRHIYISQRRVSVILGMCPMIVPII